MSCLHLDRKLDRANPSRKAGAVDNGKPGIRKDYAPGYYVAFVLDPVGNNIEVVYMS